MSKTTKLWINPFLELRHAINGWPEVPPVMASIYADTFAMKKYEKDLAKAKEDSILVEMGNYSGDIFDKELNPDSFIEYEGSVEVVYSVMFPCQGWEPCTEDFYLKAKNDGCEVRQVARLKSVEKHEPDSIFTREDVRSMIEEANVGLKDRILSGIQDQWIKDYGALDHTTSDINGYFVAGFVGKVLDEMGVK